MLPQHVLVTSVSLSAEACRNCVVRNEENRLRYEAPSEDEGKLDTTLGTAFDL